MKDTLGDRMKNFYEDRTRYYLPRRAYTIIRIDGKAFHTYTRGLVRPFDQGLIDDMDETAKYLCENIQGAKLAYVQSDEISILLTDFDDIKTEAWFDGNLQKMCSVAASLATAKFNQLRTIRMINGGFEMMRDSQLNATPLLHDIAKKKIAEFDARVFQIPSKTEVENYFIWRQQDATRNSISSVAQSFYSHKELNGKSTNEMQEMIFQKGINWNDYTSRQKRGGVVMKITEKWVRGAGSKDAGMLLINNPHMELIILDNAYNNFLGKTKEWEVYNRTKWQFIDCPIFTDNERSLRKFIPENV